MLNFDAITGFEWDAGNARKNADRHGVSQAEAEQVFVNQPLLLLDDARHSQTETRWHALGKSSQGRLLHLTFTLRGSLIRVISARDQHKKERVHYAKKS